MSEVTPWREPPRVSLRAVPPEEIEMLGEMLADCRAELGLPADFAQLESYWSELGRYPLFIVNGRELAGFILVRRPAGSTAREVAEFWVIPAQRRRGIGRAAFERMTSMFPGEWRVRAPAGSASALLFWQAAMPASSARRRDGSDVVFEMR